MNPRSHAGCGGRGLDCPQSGAASLLGHRPTISQGGSVTFFVFFLQRRMLEKEKYPGFWKSGLERPVDGLPERE